MLASYSIKLPQPLHPLHLFCPRSRNRNQGRTHSNGSKARHCKNIYSLRSGARNI